MSKKSKNEGRVTIRLPHDIYKELTTATGGVPGKMSSAILARLRGGSVNAASADELMRILATISTILDQVRQADRYDDEHMETVRLLYDGLLEKVFKLVEDGE